MKKLIIVIVLCLVATTAFGQSKPTLAILPFTGGRSGEGDTLAELFSFDKTINDAFTPIPRTSINTAIQKEQNFQMASGMTDPETISRIGKQLGARYIVAGSITRLGSQQLVVIAIMQIENLQQISGDWLTYNNISEVRSKLPEMAKKIVAASRNNTSRLQKLAVLPFQTQSGDREADALAQILAIEIIRTGTYAVFPRTKTLEQVQTEYNTQSSGITDEYSLAAVGSGDNPMLVLSGAARRLDQDRMFNAAIINVESGVQITGDWVEYQVIEDGIEAMQKLAKKLTFESDFRIYNLQALLKAVDTINRQKEGDYIITLTENIAIGFNDKGILFTENALKTITIQGDDRERSLSISKPNEPLLLVSSGITLILKGNLRLSSADVGISVQPGGTLRMESKTTVVNCFFSGVSVLGGIFTMNGGTISGNRDCGVSVLEGTFTMNSGIISDNHKGGVSVYGIFTMNGGTISGNITEYIGGGVSVGSGGTFTMSGGTISGNIADYGGGVYVRNGKNATFIKTGGTITADNRAKAIIKGGNVVCGFDNRERNSAAGPSVNLDSRISGRAGGWE